MRTMYKNNSHKTMTQTAQLKKGVCYAGLVAVTGGKMWYVHTPAGAEYHNTKTAARAAIRRAYSDNKPLKLAIMAQLDSRTGRAYILN